MKLSFDLTKEIVLENPWKKRYRAAQSLFYVCFVLFAIFVAYDIFFPTYEFNYVSGSDGLSNNIINPHTVPATPGAPEQSQLLFNLNRQGEFSSAKIILNLPKNSSLGQNASITVQKSFQSFFNPIGAPLGFKDGSLVTDGTNYYLISDGKKRMFSSLDTAQTFGLTQQMFADATASDLAYTPPGDDISDSNSLVDDMLYKVADSYYQVRGGQLWPFTSQKAFLSQYDQSEAIAQTQQFLSAQTVSENAIGYADGTLASIGQSVVILSQGKYYPINNPQTFTDLGYDWNDITPIGSDELALYTRQKLISETNEQHPDGTIFSDKAANKYYMVSNGQKLLLPSQAILHSYLKHEAVQVSSNSLTTKTLPCQLKKSFWSSNSYECAISLAPLNQLLGDDFQFSVASSATNIAPASIQVELSSSASKSNLKASLHHLIASTSVSAAFPDAQSTQPQQ